MGRDWAPFEHYLVEQRQIKQGYGSFWDFTESLVIHLDGKEPEQMYSDEEIALRRRFPFIGRFLFDDFPKLYSQLSDIEGGLDLLRKRDDELASFLKAGKIVNPNTNEYILTVDDIEGIDKDSYLVQWFAGKLDENFYYSERNNQLFIEAMVKEAVLKVLENAVAIEYKGIVFNEWTADENGIWGEMCQCCAEKYKDVLSDELSEGGAGVCSVRGCDIDVTAVPEIQYYVDFKPELIKPLSLEALLKKEGVEILEYEQDAQEKWGDLVDVMSPQECADLFGKPVRCGDEIFMPKGNEGVEIKTPDGVSLEEQINKAADKVSCMKETIDKKVGFER